MGVFPGCEGDGWAAAWLLPSTLRLWWAASALGGVGGEGSGCHRAKGRGVEVSPQTSVAARPRLVLGLLLAGTSAWVRVSYSKQGGIAAQQFGCFEI